MDLYTYIFSDFLEMCVTLQIILLEVCGLPCNVIGFQQKSGGVTTCVLDHCCLVQSFPTISGDILDGKFL